MRDSQINYQTSNNNMKDKQTAYKRTYIKRSWKLFLILIHILSFSSVNCYAKDASELLELYGCDTTDSIEVEAQRLDAVQKEYRDILIHVNSRKMLNIASKLYQQQYEASIKELDGDIDRLTKELEEIRAVIERSKEREVEYLLQLDVQYKSTRTALEKKIREKELWVNHQQKNNGEDNPVFYDETKLTAVERKLNKQRERYNEAISYPELGEIHHVRHPLNNDYQVTSPFGLRLDPITGETIEHHNALDLRASMRTEVLACFNGTVEEADYDEGLGYYVIIDHGKGIKTLYGHLDSYQVQVGQKVNQYDIIAHSGNTGTLSTGPHLHFGIYIHGTAVDPARLFE